MYVEPRCSAGTICLRSRDRYGVRACPRAELREDPSHVLPDRLRRHEESSCDLRTRQPFGHEFENLHFARTERLTGCFALSDAGYVEGGEIA